jgi:hypothetical protein
MNRVARPSIWSLTIGKLKIFISQYNFRGFSEKPTEDTSLIPKLATCPPHRAPPQHSDLRETMPRTAARPLTMMPPPLYSSPMSPLRPPHLHQAHSHHPPSPVRTRLATTRPPHGSSSSSIAGHRDRRLFRDWCPLTPPPHRRRLPVVASSSLLQLWFRNFSFSYTLVEWSGIICYTLNLLQIVYAWAFVLPWLMYQINIPNYGTCLTTMR